VSIATQFKVSDVTLVGASNIRITNVNAPTANTEVSLALSSGLKEITIRSRLISTVKIAFVSGESGTKYITLLPGATFSQGGLTLTGATIYMQTDIASNTIEVLEFF
jgi:hypothetical protein